MTDEQIWANFGKAAVSLEIAQGKFNEAKKAVVELLNKQKEVEAKDVPQK